MNADSQNTSLDSSGDNQIEIIMEQLAAQAFLPDMVTTHPFLPPNWVLGDVFESGGGPLTIPSQGFIAKGFLNINNQETMVAAVALGMSWQQYLRSQTLGFNPQLQQPLSGYFNINNPLAWIMSEYLNSYNALRGEIWAKIQAHGAGLPLYICGMGLGGPMAQLAALDLRPGQKGPDKQDAPGTQPSSYVFSTANYGNSTYVQEYTKAVTSGINNIWAGKESLLVDFFPTAPADTSYTTVGDYTRLDVLIPPNDVPWLERSDVFYLQALGGQPEKLPFIKGSFNVTPSGFSQTTAYSLANLIVAAYAQSQHPGSPVHIKPFELTKVINSKGAPFAFVFDSPTIVVVAIRGTISSQEFMTYAANSKSVVAQFSPTQASVHAGAYAIYSDSVDATGGKSLSEELFTELKSIASGKTLYLTGHDIGGAVANLAAADYALDTKKGITVDGVYTFGSNNFASIAFQTEFNKVLASKSFQIRRVKDTIPTSIGPTGMFYPVDTQMVLNGQLEIQESTYHSMDGYITLINPNQQGS